jgi:hypothetical protein
MLSGLAAATACREDRPDNLAHPISSINKKMTDRAFLWV